MNLHRDMIPRKFEQIVRLKLNVNVLAFDDHLLKTESQGLGNGVSHPF
jgi:hypothetical protein